MKTFQLIRRIIKLSTEEVASAKNLWRNQFVGEVTWEAEEYMKKTYLHIFGYGENADQMY